MENVGKTKGMTVEELSALVEEKFHEIFHAYQVANGIPLGDISPMDALQLEKQQEQLVNLVESVCRSTATTDATGRDVMDEYDVEVIEKLVKKLSITAGTKEQAFEKVERMIKREELVLTADDFTEREINVVFKKRLAGAGVQEELKAAPMTEPEVSLYVAYCGEYHRLAPLFEGISSAKNAFMEYESALKEWGEYLPELGIAVTYKEHPERDVEWGLLQGYVLDISRLDRIEDIANNDNALHLIGDLVAVVKDAMGAPSSRYWIEGESKALNKALTVM